MREKRDHIENIFRDKIGEHPTMVSMDLFDRIDEERKKRALPIIKNRIRRGYKRSLAYAAVLLLGIGIGSLYLNEGEINNGKSTLAINEKKNQQDLSGTERLSGALSRKEIPALETLNLPVPIKTEKVIHSPLDQIEWPEPREIENELLPDPGLNALIIENDDRQKQIKTKTRFALAIDFGLNRGIQKQSGNEIQAGNQAKNPLGYQVGLQIEALYGKHWSLSGGIGLQKLNYSLSVREDSIFQEMLVSETINTKKVYSIDMDQKKLVDVYITDTILDSSLVSKSISKQHQSINELKTFQIPLLVGYEEHWGKFGLQVKSGLNILIPYSSRMQGTNPGGENYYYTNKLYQPVLGVNAQLSAALTYSLRPNMELQFQPHIQYGIKPVLKGEEVKQMNYLGSNFRLRYFF